MNMRGTSYTNVNFRIILIDLQISTLTQHLWVWRSVYILSHVQEMEKKRDRNIIRVHTCFKQQKFWLYTYRVICNHMMSRRIYSVHSELLHKPPVEFKHNILWTWHWLVWINEWIRNEYFPLPRKSRLVLRLGTR